MVDQDIFNDVQQFSPAWRDWEMHRCLCGIKDAVEAIPDYYTLGFQAAQISPANATTYYIGGYGAAAPVTTAGVVRIIIPHGGVITNVHMTIWVNSTLDTAANTGTLSIRINNTTNTLLTSAGVLFNATNTFVNVDGLSITVADDDQFEIVLLTPTFTTPPVQVRMWGTISINKNG